MKKPLIIAALSALMLTLFAPALLAETIDNPPAGELLPPAAEGEVAPPAVPVTPLDACLAEALDPATCGGVPDVPPVEDCTTGIEGCEVEGTVPEEPQEVNQAALMAAEEAAAEAVDSVVSEEGPGAVDSAAAYVAALDAAREAARGVGADEETAGAVAETAAIGAVAREAASQVANAGNGGAVEGAAAYLAALGAARETGTSEGNASTAAGRAVAARSDEVSEKEEAESATREAGATRGRTGEAEGNGTLEVESAAVDEASGAGGATPDEGEDGASPAGEEGPVEAIATALPAAEGASPLVLGLGTLLLIAGIAGLLIRRRLAVQGAHDELDQTEEGDTAEVDAPEARLPQRSIR